MNADGDARTFHVAIVGAGPTGLTLANLLGLEGVSVLLVERNATTVQEPRAVSIDDESLRTMQAADVVDQVLEQVVPGYGSRYLTPGGACFLTVLPTGKPYGYARRNAFRQPVLEQQLRDGLARFPHVRTRFGADLTGFVQDDDGVDLTLGVEGGIERARARYLIGCDGASSPIRKALGLSLEGETSPERWLIVDLADSPAERDTVVCSATSGGPASRCPAPNGPGGSSSSCSRTKATQTSSGPPTFDNCSSPAASRRAAESCARPCTRFTPGSRAAGRWDACFSPGMRRT